MASFSVLQRIIDNQQKLSPKLDKLARYLESNYQEVAFLTARKVAEKAGVSEATVTRLACVCGYSGFAEFQSAIADEFKSGLSLRKHQPSDEKSIFSEVLSMEREIMDEMERQISQADFAEAVEMLFQSSRLLIVGTHAAVSAAEYMAYFMSPIKKDVILIRELNNQSFNCVKSLPENSTAVSFCFPRYQRHTLSITESLQEAGCRVIGISDSTFSPLARLSTLHLSVATKYLSYVDPFAAVMALTHALVIALMVRDKAGYRECIGRYNKFLTDQDLFLEKEIDIIDLSSALVNLKD